MTVRQAATGWEPVLIPVTCDHTTWDVASGPATIAVYRYVKETDRYEYEIGAVA
jgi:hypothetical protein